MKYEDLLLKLENNIVLCVKQMFDYLSENQIEIFAFAINISDDLAYLGFPANSLDNIDSQYKWFADDFDLELTFSDDKFLEKVNKNDVFLKKINEVVGNSFENYNKELYNNTKNDIIKIIVNALQKAKSEMNYDTSNIVFFVTMFSADDRAFIEKTSSLQLNDIKILDDFHETLS